MRLAILAAFGLLGAAMGDSAACTGGCSECLKETNCGYCGLAEKFGKCVESSGTCDVKVDGTNATILTEKTVCEAMLGDLVAATDAAACSGKEQIFCKDSKDKKFCLAVTSATKKNCASVGLTDAKVVTTTTTTTAPTCGGNCAKCTENKLCQYCGVKEFFGTCQPANVACTLSIGGNASQKITQCGNLKAHLVGGDDPAVCESVTGQHMCHEKATSTDFCLALVDVKKGKCEDMGMKDTVPKCPSMDCTTCLAEEGCHACLSEAYGAAACVADAKKCSDVQAIGSYPLKDLTNVASCEKLIEFKPIVDDAECVVPHRMCYAKDDAKICTTSRCEDAGLSPTSPTDAPLPDPTNAAVSVKGVATAGAACGIVLALA